VKYIFTVNGNVLPNNTNLVDHKPHHTPRSKTMEPKMAVSRQFTDSVANTSCRKLQAFPFKNMDVVLLIHAIFRMVTALSFVTCIESCEKVRE